jgi:RNA-binding protein
MIYALSRRVALKSTVNMQGFPMSKNKLKLSNSQKRFLRGLTHDINPVVMVGEKGLTDNVLEAIDEALDQHELIKIKLRSDKTTRLAWSETIEERFNATPVHSIGQVACFYRRNPKKPVVELPKP